MTVAPAASTSRGMVRYPVLPPVVFLAALLAACQPAVEGAAPTEQPAFAAITPGETIRLIGTEPFWGGEIAGEMLTYSTPENQSGDRITVKRFAGNSGLGFSGTLSGQPIDLAITAGTCSDGMSDRSYPYTATLRLGAEQRSGCAWTDRQGFTGPAQP